MDRAQKEALVAELSEVFDNTNTVVVAHYSGLTAAEMNDLRVKVAEAGAGFRVTKNRLTKLALDGKEISFLQDLFSGPTAIAYSDDVIAASKVVSEFAKDNEKLVILGGSMGSTQLDEAGVKALASMPSLDELRGKIVGVLQAPAAKLARTTQAPAGQLARVFGAYGASGDAA